MSIIRDSWHIRRKYNAQVHKERFSMPLPSQTSKQDLKKILQKAAQNTARMPRLNRYEKKK